MTRAEFLTRIGESVARAIERRMRVEGLGVPGRGDLTFNDHEAFGELVAAAILSCGFVIADPATEIQLASRRSDAQ